MVFSDKKEGYTREQQKKYISFFNSGDYMQLYVLGMYHSR